MLETGLLGFTNKSDGASIVVGAGRTSDAVYVVLAVMRHVVVDDQADVVDVDTTGHDVGSHQDVDAAVAELVHDFLTLALLQVGVHFAHVQLHAFQGLGHFFYLQLGRGKDDDTLRLLGLK